MKVLLTITLMITVCASLAMAADKPDNGPSDFQLEGRAVLDGVLTEDVIFDRFAGGSPYSETRYDPDCALEMSQNTGIYGYYTWCIEVTDSEPVGLEVTLFPTSDSVLAIFCDFDPADPTVGMIAYNDDSINGGFLSYIHPDGGVILNPGEQYTVVITSYGQGYFGDVQVVTTDNIVPCGVANEGTNWSTLKALYR